MVGGNVEWADVVTGDRITIDGNGTARVAIAVTAPPTSDDGAMADLVVEVASTTDLSVRTVVPFRVIVDAAANVTGDDAAVEAARHAAGEEAPGIAVPALLGVLAVAGAVTRRRP